MTILSTLDRVRTAKSDSEWASALADSAREQQRLKGQQRSSDHELRVQGIEEPELVAQGALTITDMSAILDEELRRLGDPLPDAIAVAGAAGIRRRARQLLVEQLGPDATFGPAEYRQAVRRAIQEALAENPKLDRVRAALERGDEKALLAAYIDDGTEQVFPGQLAIDAAAKRLEVVARANEYLAELGADDEVSTTVAVMRAEAEIAGAA